MSPRASRYMIAVFFFGPDELYIAVSEVGLSVHIWERRQVWDKRFATVVLLDVGLTNPLVRQFVHSVHDDMLHSITRHKQRVSARAVQHHVK